MGKLSCLNRCWSRNQLFSLPQASLVTVALLWGATNPLIKKGTKGIVQIKSDNAFKQFLHELKYLLTNVHYLAPLALNQLGSVLYFFTLQHVDLSLAVPVTNSLTFAFTAVSGRLLKEHPASKNTYWGMLLILIGTSLCVVDKFLLEK